MVELLIARGGNINEVGSKQNTPLHLAALADRKNIVEILLRQGANALAKKCLW